VVSFREATKVETVPIPASVFELPQGYEVRDSGKYLVENAQAVLKERQERQQRK
jgi:hypothetical protein